MTEQQATDMLALLAELNEHAEAAVFCLVAVATGIGILLGFEMFKLMVLGKNQRHWWCLACALPVAGEAAALSPADWSAEWVQVQFTNISSGDSAIVILNHVGIVGDAVRYEGNDGLPRECSVSLDGGAYRYATYTGGTRQSLNTEDAQPAFYVGAVDDSATSESGAIYAVQILAWGPAIDDGGGGDPPGDGSGDPPPDDPPAGDEPPPPGDDEDDPEPEDPGPPPNTGIDCIDDFIGQQQDSPLVTFFNGFTDGGDATHVETFDLDFAGTNYSFDWSFSPGGAGSAGPALNTWRLWWLTITKITLVVLLIRAIFLALRQY